MTYEIEEKRKSKLKYISVDKIDRNPDNPRIFFRTEELDNLLISISRIGVQVPITVYQDGDRYVIIDGERRWKCSKKLNLKTIPALIQDKPTKLENLLLMFNIHALREQWDLFTIAMKLPIVIELLEDEGIKPTEIQLSRYTGLSRGYIRRSRLLMALPQKYRDMILLELKKPKSKQKLSEDFFLEMEKGLKSVKKHYPEVIDNIDRIRDTLIKKYRNLTITNVLHFRYVTKISRAQKYGVSNKTAKNALKRLFQDNKYSIEDAFEDSAEEAYDERALATRIEWLLNNLKEFEIEELETGDLKIMLIELRELINELLEE